jgi:hypothetical protein
MLRRNDLWPGRGTTGSAGISEPVLKHGPNTASRKTGVNARQTTRKEAPRTRDDQQIKAALHHIQGSARTASSGFDVSGGGLVPGLTLAKELPGNHFRMSPLVSPAR